MFFFFVFFVWISHFLFLLSKLFWLANPQSQKGSDDGGKLNEEEQEVRNSEKEKKTFRREIKGKGKWTNNALA